MASRPWLVRTRRVLGVLASCVLALLVGWLLLLGLPRTAALPLAMALLVLLGHRLRPRAIVASAVALAGVAALAWRTPLRELRASLDRLQQVKDREGSTGLSARDVLGLYGLNLAMGVGGLVVGFPEAARETLFLCVPGPSVRTWESDFAMRSPKVRAAVLRLAAHAARAGFDGYALPPVRVAWPEYVLGSDSLRVALALNSPIELSGTAHREGDGWRLDLVGRAAARYPQRAVLVVGHVDGRPVALDEGLFWALQERGWLHPYTAEWRWSVSADDPRLRDLYTVDHSWRERLLTAALQGR